MSRPAARTDPLLDTWNRLLAADPERTGRCAQDLDTRMNVSPWRHAEGPIPVRPALIDERTARRITRAAAGVLRLVAAECTHRARNATELCERLGMPANPMLTDRPSWNRWALSQARPDVILHHGVPKVLECNISSAIGGVEQVARLDHAFWTWPGVRELTNSRPLWGGHTIEARRRLLSRIARSRGVRRPQVAIAGWSPENFTETMIDAASNGIPCVFVTQEELTEDGGLRNGQGLRIDLFLQKFVTVDSYARGEPMAALEAAVANDSTFIASPEVSNVYSNKKVLAWLTERAPDLPGEQREIIARHLPWTAVLADRKVERHGTEHDLLAMVEDRRSDFVIKPTDGHSAQGVLIGRETTPEQWRTALERGLGGNHVVQEFCEPDRLPATTWDPGSGEVVTRSVPHLISPLLIDGVGTGFLARFLKTGESSLISLRLGALNTVFVHE